MTLARQALENRQHQIRSAKATLDLQQAGPEYGTVTNLHLGRQLELTHGRDRQQKNVEVAGNVDSPLRKTQWDQTGHLIRQDDANQTLTWTWYRHDAECNEHAGVDECHKPDAEVYGIPHFLTGTEDLKIKDQQRKFSHHDPRRVDDIHNDKYLSPT